MSTAPSSSSTLEADPFPRASLSSGIGLETVRQLSLRPDALIVAAARNPQASKELQALVAKSEGKIETVVLDVTDEASIAVRRPAVELEMPLAGPCVPRLTPSARSPTGRCQGNARDLVRPVQRKLDRRPPPRRRGGQRRG